MDNVMLRMKLIYSGKAILIGQLFESHQPEGQDQFLWTDPDGELKPYEAHFRACESWGLWDNFITAPSEFSAIKDKNGIQEAVYTFDNPEDRGEYVDRLISALNAYCKSRTFTRYERIYAPEAVESYLGKEVVPIMQNDGYHPTNYFLEGVLNDGRFVCRYKPTPESIFPKYDIFKMICTPVKEERYHWECQGVLDDKKLYHTQELTITITK